jgi:hypothetical protein
MAYREANSRRSWLLGELMASPWPRRHAPDESAAKPLRRLLVEHHRAMLSIFAP